MHRSILAFAATISCLTASPGTSGDTTAGKTGGTPNIVIEETTYDAREVIKGETFSHDFQVKNTGNAPLEILEAKPSCGCTVTDFDRIVPPGGTGKVRAAIDTNKTATGDLAKTVTVRSNDPDQPQIFLQMKAKVTTFVDVLPSTINIRVDRGKPANFSLLLHPNAGNVIEKIQGVEAVDVPSVKSTVRRLDREEPADTPSAFKGQKGDYRIELSVPADLPLGVKNGILRVSTSSTKTPKIEVPLSVTVAPLITLLPQRITFRLLVPRDSIRILANETILREKPDPKSAKVGTVGKADLLALVAEEEKWFHVQGAGMLDGFIPRKSGERIPPGKDSPSPSASTRTLSIMKKEATDFRLNKVDIDPSLGKDITFEIKPIKDGQSYNLTLTYKGALEKGTRTGSLWIQTNDPAESRLEVPVSITIS